MSADRILISIVEDDVVLREHLAQVVSNTHDLELLWSAGSLEQARDELGEKPDVVLVDLGLPDGNGAELIAEMAPAGVKSLIITIFDDRASVLGAIRSGADGYLVKDSGSDEILDAIRSLADGGSPVSASAAIHMMSIIREIAPGGHPEPEGERLLTKREIELLALFAKGLTYREAAKSLGISPHTVGDQVKSIYRKLAVHSRSEAVYEAIFQKLIKI